MTIWYHLYNPSTDTHYSNGGYINPDSEVPKQGFEWVPGHAPEESTVFLEVSLQERLNSIFLESLFALQLSDTEQIHFIDTSTTVKTCLDVGAIGAAKNKIQNVRMPDGSELVPEIKNVQQRLLGEFPI